MSIIRYTLGADDIAHLNSLIIFIYMSTNTNPARIIPSSKSPFVYKTSREQFVRKYYTMLLHLNCDTYSSMYFEYFINILLFKLTNFLSSKIEITEILIKK